jgi:uncharacterized protein YqeY
MAIADEVRADLKDAMRAGERERVGALRLLLSELQKAFKEGESDEVAVLRRERKRRRDAAAAYLQGDRQDLADREDREAELIAGYLPTELSDENLRAIVAQAVQDTGSTSMGDMGRVMKQAMAAAGGRADGARVSALVRAALSA